MVPLRSFICSSLGPLIGWLVVNENELLCLVTKNSKVIQIDHVPLSLLKSHTRHAFEVILKNHLGNLDVHCGGDSLTLTGGMQNLVNINKVLPVAARFVFDCLDYLPSEFRGLASDVLLSGMRSVIKDAPSAIFQNCNQMAERLMLHEIGLSIGIIEWIDDYHAFCSTTSHNDLLRPSEATFLGAAGPDVITGPKHIRNTLDTIVPVRTDRKIEEVTEVCHAIVGSEVSSNRSVAGCAGEVNVLDVALVIESIRRDEFGLDQNISDMESSLLKKQHASLGRALHCLSQELYSQDSHFYAH